jgi:hypothetical protein
LDGGKYILSIAEEESASDVESGCDRIFLGGDGVESICRLIGVDVNENGSERIVYSWLQMDLRCAGINDDVGPGKRYY